MTFFGSSQITGETNLGARRFASRGAGGALWYNPLNSAAITTRIAAGGLLAWRAQANSTTYGPGPADYASSLISVEGSATALVEGNGAVPWAGVTGWSFNGAASQYFDTGLIPANDQSWLMFVQYSNTVGDDQVLAGMRHTANRTFSLQPRVVGLIVRYQNGSFTQPAPQMDAGNLAVVGNQGYRNGVAEGGVIGPWGGASLRTIYIGCYNVGVPSGFITADIQAVLICDDATAFTGPDITAIAASPGGSMHNL